MFSRGELLERVWGSSAEWQDPATVTEHVRRLRRRIERNPAELALPKNVLNAQTRSAKSATTNFQDKANVYYGDQSKHEFLERTTWHSGQHVRQYRLVLETLGVTPDRPLPEETWEGLPMPVKVWDDEKPFAA